MQGILYCRLQRAKFGQLVDVLMKAVVRTVEGSARRTEADYLRFLDMAYGSAQELSYQVSIAHRLGYLSPQQYEPLNTQAVETSKCLNGLIRSLR